MDDKIKEYWDRKILDWEKNAYEESTSGQSLVEKVASKFRGSLRERMNIALGLVQPHVGGQTVLDLGCGSGTFCFRLLQNGAAKTIGFDFSPHAISVASERAKTLGVEDKCDFEVHDIREATLPPVDITTGLGLLDYLNGDELVQFLGKVHSKYFLFTFSEKKLSVMNALHLLYLKSQKCPSAYHYGEAEMRGFLEKADLNDFRFVRDPRMSIGTIVCHLPDSPLANTKI